MATTETYHISHMLTILSKIIKTDNLEEIFAILQDNCEVSAMTIYETNGEISAIKKSFQKELPINQSPSYDLKINGVTFGKIIYETKTSNREFLKLISEIIADKIKNYEFKQIISQQISALQEGILQQDNDKRIKNNFFASVTHELRTPLNSIIGYSELLMQGFGGDLSEKQREYLLDIQTSGLNLLNMINDILDFSKISAENSYLNVSEFDIEKLFFEVTNTIKPLLKKKNLKLKTSIENYTLNADYRKTYQILINLLSNAIKFSPNSDVIELYSLYSDKKRIIVVKDNGIGIPKRSQRQIFKEYTQGANNKLKENSTGLGLAIVKKFCNLHGWKIKLESEENKGSTFIIKLD